MRAGELRVDDLLELKPVWRHSRRWPYNSSALLILNAGPKWFRVVGAARYVESGGRLVQETGPHRLSIAEMTRFLEHEVKSVHRNDVQIWPQPDGEGG